MAAWLALWTALVCALMPLGPVQARHAGSAFDPTTSVVALSPRTQRLPEAELRGALPSREDPGPGIDLIVALPASPSLRPRIGNPAIVQTVAVAFLPSARSGNLGARAPPRG